MTKFFEILHSSHPEHKLKLAFTERKFMCNGCKCWGIGDHYTCSLCNFDLHSICAMPFPSIRHHFYKKCSLEFHQTPPADPAGRFCNACGKDADGFLYHCNHCGTDLHPCCAKLFDVLDVGEAKLYLLKKSGKSCDMCGLQRPDGPHGWSYRSKKGKYHLHVGCLKDKIEENWNEIFEHGENGNFQTRIPKLENMFRTRFHNGNGNNYRKFGALALTAVKLLLGDPSPFITVPLNLFMPDN